MLFPTGEFLLAYLPVTLALFFLIGSSLGQRAAASWLTVASLCFYGLWRPVHVLLLVASIVFNYWAGGLILNARVMGLETRARFLVAVVVAVDLGVLAIFKYGDFLISSAAALTGGHYPALGLALPLGISFFTFTQIAYLVDVYAGKAVERSPLRYALFVTYFPHLVAGPVLHHSQMMPQFADSEIYLPQLKGLANGMAFLLIGLFKKVLIADSMAPLANAVFTAAGVGPIAGGEAWRGVLAYTLQIYFDFSGYSDMAVGLSLLFNIRLPYNFNSPYQAGNISDFWRRWHMTLSAFLRDYLYIGLGGNRHGAVRRYANLLVTMLLGGLWHGASWTFVVWGGLHGIYLVINHAWRWLLGRGENRIVNWFAAATLRLTGWGLTMFAVVVAWVFFRASTFNSAWTLLRAMFGVVTTPAATAPGAVTVLAGDSTWQWLWISALLLGARWLPNSQECIDGYLARWMEQRRDSAQQQFRAVLLGFAMVIAVLLVVICESRNVTEFIYFNF